VHRSGWRAVGAVAGWQAAASLCYYSVFAATTYLRGTFGVSRTAVGVLTAVATLGYTLLLFPSGAAVDGFGEKRVMLAGCGAATTLALLAVRRV
jgi:MFS family permease